LTASRVEFLHAAYVPASTLLTLLQTVEQQSEFVRYSHFRVFAL